MAEQTDDQLLEQLMKLKALTKETGMLHDAQVFQLKMYPLVLTHAVKSEITFKYQDEEVIFNITETKGKKPKDIDKRLKLLEQYTQTLLGDNYKVKVKIKRKVIFSSGR